MATIIKKTATSIIEIPFLSIPVVTQITAMIDIATINTISYRSIALGLKIKDVKLYGWDKKVL